MLRCDQPAPGKYIVTFRKLHGLYGDVADAPVGYVDYNAEIGDHGDLYDTFPADHSNVSLRGAVKRDPEGQPIVLEAGPRVSETEPYTGELCIHELDWVRQIPGRTYNRNRHYAARQLED